MKVALARTLLAIFLFGPTVPVFGNPTGGAVVAGSATIGSAGATLTINQSTPNAIINWQQFSIAGGESTKFIVPNASSATLNRVLGGNPSAIYGTLQSNGILYLVNPSGIVVGPSGRIDTASFLASTLNVSNQQFLKGDSLNFSGSSDASIDNEGIIQGSSGGVYLIANQVNNKGTLSAPQGSVGLAAGSDILFQQAGNQHLFVQATPAGTSRATGVTNAGTIRAAAAELKAAGGNAYALAINNTGSIAATGYKKVNGQVYLTSDSGNISNSGNISATTGNHQGGHIVVTSKSGKITNSGTLEASATAKGGQGGSVTLKSAQGTTVNTASGQILAIGGSGGAGGKIETSGESLQISGTVSAGPRGSWLLDPSDVTIDNGGGLAPDVNVATLEAGLNAGTSETVQANGGGADSGNIDLNANLTWTSSALLQLTATGNINLNQALSGTGGTLSLSAGGAVSDTAALSVASFILQNGSWAQNSATLPAFTASHDFEIQNRSTFLRVTGGNGTTNPYQITDIYGLQGLGSPSSSLLGANAVLENDIDASATATWDAGQGFSPIGVPAIGPFTGTFNGQNHTIDGLFIDLPNNSSVGLFGEIQGGTLENIGVTNVQIKGADTVGALLGAAESGVALPSTVHNVFSTGSVTANSNLGGLIGQNFGNVDDAYNTATVSTGLGGGAQIGGLVGTNGGSLTNVYSTGSVITGGDGINIGGLVGYNTNGTIHNAYSSGTVTANAATRVGGLVGLSDGTPSYSNTFWDTDTAGVSLGIGTDSTNSTPGVTGATTTQLMTQSYILAHAPTPPTWDFTNVWTTNGDTTTPQLITQGVTSASDTLSGTAFTNSGLTLSSGVIIDLIFDGSLLDSTTTNSSGGFTFNISATSDLTGGILLTDATDKGNTFYQTNTPPGTILGIDLWGGTLRVMADAASNTALKQAVGSLTGSGINYAVSGLNLSTNSGVSMSILSNYDLDGNITSAGTFDTGTGAILTGSPDVTVMATAVAMSGTFHRGGALAITSTTGGIVFTGVGALATPATASAVTLNAMGAVNLQSSYLTLGGNITANAGTSIDLNATVNAASATLTSLGALSIGAPANPSTITADSFVINAVGPLNIDGTINASGLVTMVDTGSDITFGPAGTIIDSGSGNNVIVGAGTSSSTAHSIINNSTVGGSSANAIQVSGGANFYLYSSDPALDTLGGISVPQANVIFNATYPATSLPNGNAELFYVASSGGGPPPPPPPPPHSNPPPPSTDTGGAAGAGSNIVPPALTPQPTTSGELSGEIATLGNPPPPLPFNFAANDASGLTGQQDGDLADSSSNRGQIGAGDAAQLGGGGLNNVANPQAAGVLTLALGPVVYHNLADALKGLGDWADVPPAAGGTSTGDDQETILEGGQVAEMDKKSVKSIPLEQAPQQLKNAMSGDVLNGIPAGAGH